MQFSKDHHLNSLTRNEFPTPKRVRLEHGKQHEAHDYYNQSIRTTEEKSRRSKHMNS
ncbi:hypothetical protein PanWU01x14_105160, partial [Parasponia andersonii]